MKEGQNCTIFWMLRFQLIFDFNFSSKYKQNVGNGEANKCLPPLSASLYCRFIVSPKLLNISLILKVRLYYPIC